MAAMEVVLAWDSALRKGDWVTARALLADDATYTAPEAPEDEPSDCRAYRVAEGVPVDRVC